MSLESDRLGDLLLEPRGSRWPKILGLLLLFGLVSGAGYWFYLHPEQLDWSRLKAQAKSVLETPIMTSPVPPPPPPSPDDQLTPTWKPDK